MLISVFELLWQWLRFVLKLQCSAPLDSVSLFFFFFTIYHLGRESFLLHIHFNNRLLAEMWGCLVPQGYLWPCPLGVQSTLDHSAAIAHPYILDFFPFKHLLDKKTPLLDLSTKNSLIYTPLIILCTSLKTSAAWKINSVTQFKGFNYFKLNI